MYFSSCLPFDIPSVIPDIIPSRFRKSLPIKICGGGSDVGEIVVRVEPVSLGAQYMPGGGGNALACILRHLELERLVAVLWARAASRAHEVSAVVAHELDWGRRDDSSFKGIRRNK